MVMELNRSQRLGLDIDRHIALDAGAGTGKTTVMAHRYVQHLLSSQQRATLLLPTPPRTSISGIGKIRCPSKDRTSLPEWPGLLPTETVAITFTRKAAAELKGRIRRLIAKLRSTSPAKGDTEGIYDPRLRSQGDVAMLLSLVDDAPISTIDSFLSSVVSPWIGLVCDDPAMEQIDEHSSALLREESIRIAWRLQHGIHGIEVGMQGDIESFLQARDRLSILLGGQFSASELVQVMMKRSLFVEEARRKIGFKGTSIDISIFDRLFIEPVEDIIDAWYLSFRTAIDAWKEAWLERGAAFADDAPSGMTRFRYVQYLCDQPATTRMEKLQWAYLASLSIATEGNLGNIDCKPLTHARLPNSGGWPGGIFKPGDTVLADAIESIIIEKAKEKATNVRELMANSGALLIRQLGKASFLLNPLFEDPTPIPDTDMQRIRLDIDIPQIPPSKNMRLTSELELQVIQDLFTVHEGVRQIQSRLKSQAGVKDYDDTLRLAEDLLLTRCPSVCRTWYPTPVIEALDSLGEEPWLDEHLSKAIIASKSNQEVHDDLMRRIDIVRELRRQYRAFIIDEYQDTNPQHFRLLSRLWGRRKISKEDPRPPASDWDPTICIVGDMKQSIYRFRQAEVTVMRTSVEAIRRMNREEFAAADPRIKEFLKPNKARDPRAMSGTGFTTASILSTGKKLEEWNLFGLADDDNAVDTQSIERRKEGHIDMRSNHRTLPGLLNAMNSIFNDTFSERHHSLPGPWHAAAQDLTPSRESDKKPALEWILPTRLSLKDRPQDMKKPINHFTDEDSEDRELAADLMAKRIASLLNGGRVRIKDTTDDKWLDVKENREGILPQDILILVSARSRIPTIMKALEDHGIPVVADKQGYLMQRPVVRPLMALLRLLISPRDRGAALAVGRSVFVGLEDKSLIATLTPKVSADKYGNQLQLLINSAPNEAIKQLLVRVKHLSENGDFMSSIKTMIDHSDLLYAYPREGDRQDVENWLTLYQNLSDSLGADPSLIYSRMCEIGDLGKDALQSQSDGAAGAVQIMTIHGSKGLEAPIVIAWDIFKTGTKDTSVDSVLVTPDIIAGKINPWKGHKGNPESGLYTLAKLFEIAQSGAERRRQFYVALTRARDRLILVGGPKGVKMAKDNKSIEVKRSGSIPTHGTMFLDGLAHSSIEAGNTDGVWSKGGIDQTGKTLNLKPADLFKDSQIMGLNSISIFHHPDCFDDSTNSSVLQSWELRLENAKKSHSKPPVIEPRIANFTVSMTSHGLDVADSCKRRHWLSSQLNWRAERFELLSVNEEITEWPSATEFGSLFHRLLEIGLPNPGSEAGNLEQLWIQKQGDKLTDEDTVEQVMAQSSITDAKILAKTRSRLLHLGQLARNGALGILASGKRFDGYKVEGLRTELPFYFTIENHPKDRYRHQWTPNGAYPNAVIEKITAIFDGRADLVLALVDESGQGWLQVVDAKTTGCLSKFNVEDLEKGHPLQKVTDPESPFATTSSEEDIIADHRLQLALYSRALEMGESLKPENARRKILPPAIQVSASGRMIRMTDDDYEKAKKDLDSLVKWMGETAAMGEESEAPSKLPMAEKQTCYKCPYHSGDIKLCGPEPEKTGPARPTSQENHP